MATPFIIAKDSTIGEVEDILMQLDLKKPIKAFPLVENKGIDFLIIGFSKIVIFRIDAFGRINSHFASNSARERCDRRRRETERSCTPQAGRETPDSAGEQTIFNQSNSKPVPAGYEEQFHGWHQFSKIPKIPIFF